MERSLKSVAMSFMAAVIAYVLGFFALVVIDMVRDPNKATGLGALVGTATSALPVGAAIVAFVATLLLRNRRKP